MGGRVVVLVVLAAVWLAVRVVVGLRMVVRSPEPACPTRRPAEREPQDTVRSSCGVPASPQDSSWHPQDAVPVPAQPTTTSTPGLTTVGLTLIIAAVVWQQLSTSVGALAAARAAGGTSRTHHPVKRTHHPVTPTGGPDKQSVATFRQTVIDRVARPEQGPACFGGRDNTAYLRGWDDAVDWIGKAHDAEPPTWGDIAYMTGWSEAVRAIDRARRCAIG